MKKIFSTVTLFLLIFISQKTNLAFAQGVTIDLDARAIGENITILYKGTSSATIQPIISDKEIVSVPADLVLLPGLEPKLAGLTPITSWQTKKVLIPGVTYFVRVFDIRTKGFLTENQIVERLSINLLSAGINKKSAREYVFYGEIDKNKHKDTDTIPYSSIKVSGGIYDKETDQIIVPLSETSVNKDGEYSFNIISPLSPGVSYQTKLSFVVEKNLVTEKNYNFTTDKGVVPETGKTADNFYDSNSYRLLAPIPGMTALLDPSLCQERKLVNPGEICDINAFLNFILSLIIGIAAVILVIRLIITGYGYMITDVPFVKAKLKGGFKDALLGLIFALASYVILNTINPRLVSNDFTIGAAEFDVERFGDVDANFVPPVGGGASFNKANFPKDVMCPGTGGRGSIRAIAGSWSGRATYGQGEKTPKGYPPRGNVGPGGTFMLDCSSYVATVLECAGIKPPQKASAINTKSIFEQMAGAEKVSSADFVQSGDKIFVKGKELLPGDLVGWRGNRKKNKREVGHVVIYVGGGMFRESQVGGWNMGNSVQKEKSLSYEMSAMDGSFQGYVLRINP